MKVFSHEGVELGCSEFDIGMQWLMCWYQQPQYVSKVIVPWIDSEWQS
jgi:hypothetical protein